MCQFFSAIVTKNDIIYDLNNDQHEELIKKANLNDSTLKPNFVRVELINKDVFDRNLNNWKLIIDQDMIPEWFNKDIVEQRVKKLFASIYDKIILIDQKDVKLHNRRVFIKNSSVIAYGHSSVKAYGKSSVEANGQSSVEAYGYSSVVANGHSSVNAFDHSSVEAYGNSFIAATDHSSVEAYGYSSVVANGCSSVVANGCSSVNYMPV